MIRSGRFFLAWTFWLLAGQPALVIGDTWLRPGAAPSAYGASITPPRPLSSNDLRPGLFLVANKDMPDPRFRGTVVYLARHDANGTLGVIVNRRTQATLAGAVDGIDPASGAMHAMYYGGPVALDRLLALQRTDTATAGLSVDLVTERPALFALLADPESPKSLRVYLGHSGWGIGQLATELAGDDWYLIEGCAEMIFTDEPAVLWDRLIDRLSPDGLLVRSRPAPAA